MSDRPTQRTFNETGEQRWIAAAETEADGPTMQGTLFDSNENGLEMDWRGRAYGNNVVDDYDPDSRPAGGLL